MTDCLPAIAALHYVTKKIKQFLLGSILSSIYFLFEGSVLILTACSRLGCYQHGRKARINENEGQDWVLGKTTCLWAHFIKIPLVSLVSGLDALVETPGSHFSRV